MAYSISQFVLRLPRHAASGDAGFPVAVRRSTAESPVAVAADLLDLSRHGFRLRTAVPLEIGESLYLDVFEEKSGLTLALPATVRWRLEEPDRRWLLGCQTKQELDWETLGELFLSQVLVADTGRA
jgi:hypothetical protein